MSDQDTIFENEVPAAPVDKAVEPSTEDVKASDTPSSGPDYADLLGEIKNEDGQPKYSSMEDALKALKHSQEFIPQLLKEKKELESAAAKAIATEELLAEIGKAKSTPEGNPSQGIDEATLQSLIDAQVNSTLTAREQQRVESENANKVISSLSKVFGDGAKSKFVEAAEANGISVETLNSLSRTSPEAALKLIGVQEKKSDLTPHSSINTESMAPTREEGSLKFKDNFSAQDLTNLWQNARKRVTQE